METLTSEQILQRATANPSDAIVLVMDPEGKLEEHAAILQILEDSRFKLLQVSDPENWFDFCQGEGGERFEVFDGGLAVAHETDDLTTRASDCLERFGNGRFTLFNGDREQLGEFSATKTPELSADSVRTAVDDIMQGAIVITLDKPVEANILGCDFMKPNAQAPEGTDLRISEIKIRGISTGNADVVCKVEGRERPFKLDLFLQNAELRSQGDGHINHRFVGDRNRMPSENLKRVQDFLGRLNEAINFNQDFKKAVDTHQT